MRRMILAPRAATIPTGPLRDTKTRQRTSNGHELVRAEVTSFGERGGGEAERESGRRVLLKYAITAVLEDTRDCGSTWRQAVIINRIDVRPSPHELLDDSQASSDGRQVKRSLRDSRTSSGLRGYRTRTRLPLPHLCPFHSLLGTAHYDTLYHHVHTLKPMTEFRIEPAQFLSLAKPRGAINECRVFVRTGSRRLIALATQTCFRPSPVRRFTSAPRSSKTGTSSLRLCRHV